MGAALQRGSDYCDDREPYSVRKARIPTLAVPMGDEKSLGAEVGEMVKIVAANVEVQTLPGPGHFLP
jgi:hypothetical protein